LLEAATTWRLRTRLAIDGAGKRGAVPAPQVDEAHGTFDAKRVVS
jgi:hypothetical protein